MPRIDGLPDHLRDVPTSQEGWLTWKEDIALYREWVKRTCESDQAMQAVVTALCTKDPAYFLTIFGVIFEPRQRGTQRPGWYPWTLYASQVDLIRFIEGAASRHDDPTGKGDGVIEKSRDMGATWTLCGYVAHQWLFADAFVAGLVSRKEDLVDDPGNPDAMFYKVEGILGIEKSVPEDMRLPTWLFPRGFEAKFHDLKLKLIHPSKPNVILGESTTAKSGVGGRATMRINDEASKIEAFGPSWSSQSASTAHRIALSSADLRYGADFYNLARQAERASTNPDISGPAYFRLNWFDHPERDLDWYDREKARHANDPHGFAREYDIDYHAGLGDWVYPLARQKQPGSFPYDPRLGQLSCAIDPGLRDPSSFIWLQYDPGHDRYRVVNGIMVPGAAGPDYCASLLVGFPLSGPDGYDYTPAELDLMTWTGSLRATVIYVGDPFGDNSGGSGKETFYDALARTSRTLTDGTHRIAVRTKFDEGARFHPARKTALNDLLPRLDFHDAPGPRYVLDALKENHYRAAPDGRPTNTEPTNPVHDWSSHATAALEYFAVHRAVHSRVEHLGRIKPIRATLSGTVIRPPSGPRAPTLNAPG